MEYVTLKTRPDFPVTPFEQFTVKDGMGRVVENWRHVESHVGKKSAQHTYAVDGYSVQL